MDKCSVKKVLILISTQKAPKLIWEIKDIGKQGSYINHMLKVFLFDLLSLQENVFLLYPGM